MNWSTVLMVFLAVAVIFNWHKSSNLSNQLDIETARHELTRIELRAALEDNARWAAAMDEAVEAVAAQKELAEACMQREARIRAAADERAAIMRKASPQARNTKDTVIDHETRARVTARLNRPL